MWRMKNVNIFGFDRKIWFLGGGGHENPIYKWGLPKKEETWTVCRFKGALQERGVWVFLRGDVDTPMYTMLDLASSDSIRELSGAPFSALSKINKAPLFLFSDKLVMLSELSIGSLPTVSFLLE